MVKTANKDSWQHTLFFTPAWKNSLFSYHPFLPPISVLLFSMKKIMSKKFEFSAVTQFSDFNKVCFSSHPFPHRTPGVN
jgi:hypothetical protein